MQTIDAFTVLGKDQLTDMLNSNGVPLPDLTDRDSVLEAARAIDVDQVLFGRIEKRGAIYLLTTDMYNSSDGSLFLRGEENAVGLEDIDLAAENITREISRKLLPEEKHAQVEQKLDEEAALREQTSGGESLSSFEELAKNDPEAALEKVDEGTRQAIREKVKEDVKEEARQEVVEEEIQKLYAEEKETERQRKIRLWQFWSNVGFTGLDYWASVSGMIATQNRLDSGKAWGSYMYGLWSGYDPYESYWNEYNHSKGFLISSEVSEVLSYTGRSIAQIYYNPVNIGIPAEGRDWYRASIIAKTLADYTAFGSGMLGYEALRTYNGYQEMIKEDPQPIVKMNESYDEYRTLYNLYRYGSITSYAMLGFGGTAVALALLSDGEHEALVQSRRARFFYMLGQGLSGAGNVSSGIALGYRARMEEQRVSENNDPMVPGVIYDSLSLRFWTWSGMTWGFWAAGLAAQLYAINLPPAGTSESGNEEAAGPLVFSILPVPGGIQAVVGVSW
jgi:hypothetical protein